MCFERVLLGASAELLVAERSPQIPTGHGPEGPPFFTESFDIAASSIDICDRPFESDVAQGKYVWMPKGHDTEN